ncbi:MAG TPA: glycosyltransferase family 4 protein [Kofleriaceae bacterium]|nr:glycosyltransferase family 4 protein [Kofleriaceae bacterium]
MNLLYLSLSYIPSRRASSVHVMRMSAALSRAGHQVELVGKQNREPRDSNLDDHAFYGVDPTFTITKLPKPAFRGGGLVFAGAMARTLLARRSTIDLVYSRELIGALVAAELRIPVVFESHGVETSRPLRALTRRLARHPMLRGMVAISDALRRDLEAEQMAPAHAPLVIAHDAADAPGAVNLERPRRARPKVGYVGSLYAGRGIELILELAKRLPDYDVELVGGTEADLAKWRAYGLAPNVTLVGFVPPSTLRARYESFDVLLMPHPKHGVAAATGIDISRWTSPMKMFEYMASGTPLVASDLPVLAEVLRHEHNALIAPADDLPAWEAAVRRLVDDRALARSIASRAYDDLVEHYTWDARVKTIFTGLGSLGTESRNSVTAA